jgi:hypothetical protein
MHTADNPRLVRFVGGDEGPWGVTAMTVVSGSGLATVSRLAVLEAGASSAPRGAWELRGAVSHARYVERREADALRAVQPALGRAEATCAAMIPIRKSEAWWALPQDERRAIFEERSRHVAGTMRFLPAIARRLHHARDLGEPFDFITWFEFAPAHAPLFDELVGQLRATEEWAFVDRELDVRLER